MEDITIPLLLRDFYLFIQYRPVELLALSLQERVTTDDWSSYG